jgi:hypothetical protein
MSKDTPEVEAARIEVERARAQLMATARDLQDEILDVFSPHTWARDIWEGAKEKGAGLAEEAVDAVRKRPAIVSGAVAAIALFLAREPLLDMAGKLAKDVGTKRKTRKARNTKTRQKDTETIE